MIGWTKEENLNSFSSVPKLMCMPIEIIEGDFKDNCYDIFLLMLIGGPATPDEEQPERKFYKDGLFLDSVSFVNNNNHE